MKKEKFIIKQLPEVVFFQEGPGVRNHQYTTDGVKLLNVANLQKGRLQLDKSERYISEDEAYGKYNHFLVDEGDLIIASSGIKVEYFEEKMGFALKEHLPLCMNTSTIRFKSLNNDTLDIRYFMYFLKSIWFKKQIARLITGSAQLNFGPSHLKQIEVPIADIKVQYKVVNVLDKARELINKRKEQIEACDELIKSQFVEMFGNPIINNKKYEVKLGENIFKLSNGKTVPQNKRLNEGIPAYGGNGISYYTEGVLFEKDTIVVGRVGFQSGNVHIVKGPLWITDNAMYISDILDSGYELEFLYALMEHIDFTRFQDPGDLKKITQKPFMQMEYIKPPLSLQKEYISFVQCTDKLKFEMEQSLVELENNFNSLMQRAFKGELF